MTLQPPFSTFLLKQKSAIFESKMAEVDVVYQFKTTTERDENGKDSKRVETKNGYDDAIDQTVNSGFIVYTVTVISNTQKKGSRAL